MKEYLHIYLEGKRWIMIPNRLKNVVKYLDIRPHCDQSFQIYAFPKAKFNNTKGVKDYVKQYKFLNDQNSNKILSCKLPEVLSYFGSNWNNLIVDGQRIDFTNKLPFHKINFKKMKKEDQTFLMAIGNKIDTIYSLYLPSGKTEFEKLEVVFWDGNFKSLIGSDTMYWYYIWWAGS